jgi:hypothetical protein
LVTLLSILNFHWLFLMYIIDIFLML